MSVLAAMFGVWAVLLCGAVWANEKAKTERVREVWRSVMSGLCGVAVSVNRARGPRDENR